MTDVNRFGYSSNYYLFHGVSTYQDLVAATNPQQVAGVNDPTADGPSPLIDNAAEVFAGLVPDPTAGAACYWSPKDTQTGAVMTAFQNHQIAFPSGVGDPQCFCYPDCSTSQIVVKVSMPENTGPGTTNSPAFMFERQRPAGGPAVVQIQ
jgi:hypothetical protein